MASKNQTTTMIIGVVLLLVAAALAYWGYDMSNEAGNRLVKAFSGSTKDEVILAYGGAILSGVAGLFLLLRK